MKCAEVPTLLTTRKRWTVRGQVQGVGFRPFVYRLARELGLGGWVRNDSSQVVIEVEGLAAKVEEFGRRLEDDRPALARYEQIGSEVVELAGEGQGEFAIVESQVDGRHRPVVTVDTAVCGDCLREMKDPADFRFGYGLINCTHCGPRYSIIKAMPYDRANTTMARFVLCEKCREQYMNPADRRFHAQPVACGECGPKVGMGERGYKISDLKFQIGDLRSEISDCEEPIAKAAGLLVAGKIVAIKGIGGFHLACRADDVEAVKRLRDRKKRDAKPFALMCADVEVAKQLVDLSDEAMAELMSPAAPIVLGKRKDCTTEDSEDSEDAEAIKYRNLSSSVSSESSVVKYSAVCLLAPGTNRLGVMLPYTPIQHLLFATLKQRSTINTLVMTSANVSDEPLVKNNDEARERLAGIADAILWHDRDIERCVDDSIVLDMGEGERVLPIRRARGYVPGPISIKSQISNPRLQMANGLCVGGELKNTVAVVRGDEVIVSQHLGDLKHALGFEYFKKTIEDLCGLMEVRPEWIAHDLHPAYLSTQWAGELAKMWSVPFIPVQHHHAHAAAVLAEHGVAEPALAVVCDGVGYGTDGTAWGGELLGIGDWGRCTRIAHLPTMLLPGGDVAARDTRRCAAGLLWGLFQQGVCEGFHRQMSSLFPDSLERQMVLGMLQTGTGCVVSSSAGRLFDAVAGILGVCMTNEHEAQAPMALESIAENVRPREYRASGAMLDMSGFFAEMIQRHEQGESAGQLSADFHEVFAQTWAQAVGRTAEQTGVRIVGLSGGVFCNALLTRRMTQLLAGRGLRVLRHEIVPPNDGGIAFGQAAVAKQRMKSEG